MNNEKLKNFAENFKEYKTIYSLYSEDLQANTDNLFKSILDGDCDQETMDFALSLGEYVSNYKRAEADFFDSSKASVEKYFVSSSSDEQKASSKNNGYGIGLYLNKQRAVVMGLIAGLVHMFFKDSESKEIYEWIGRVGLFVAVFLIPAPTFFFIGIDAWIILALYFIASAFIGTDKTDEGLAFLGKYNQENNITFLNSENLHPVLKQKIDLFNSLMLEATIDNYREIGKELSDLTQIFDSYKNIINDPEVLINFENLVAYIDRLDSTHTEWLAGQLQSVKLTSSLLKKSMNDDNSFEMTKNVAAEITNLNSSPEFEGLMEGYKASLLKEGILKEYRDYVDESDSPESLASQFKECVEKEDWDVAGITYGYMYAQTQQRRRAEEKAKKEADAEANARLAKAMGKVVVGAPKSFAKGVSEARSKPSSKTETFLKGAVTGALANQVFKPRQPSSTKSSVQYWEGSCNKCGSVAHGKTVNNRKAFSRKCANGCGYGSMTFIPKN